VTHAFDFHFPFAALRMKEGTFTIREVASWMGVTYMTARRIMKQHGVQIRYAGKKRGGRGAPPSVYNRVK
jgi:predicted ArsR family transcriptional regulator